jgi:DNA primase
VDPDKQFYHCFGCGAGGDVFSFVMQYEHVEFPEAARILAERAGSGSRRPAPGTTPARRERQE